MPGTGLVVDNVEAYIPGDRRRALGRGAEMPDRVNGAALFADISGFTPLTEALVRELGVRRGPEELTRALDQVFDAVLEKLHRYGGSVIYFSGDAVTCWFDRDDGEAAVGCGLAMQEAVAEVGTITTPGGTTVQLGMKVAVAAGPARRFVVGDPEIQLIDVLAGSLLDRLADLEHHADRGEVLVDATTLEYLGDRVELVSLRQDHGDPVASPIGVVADISTEGRTIRLPPPPPRLPRAVVREWILPPVYDRLVAGRGEFLAELRPVIPMFLRFGGFDFDLDDDAPGRLDDFIKRAQRIVDGFGGNVLQLTIGDKGAYLYAVFGSPMAHEDDAARACHAALDLLGLEGTTDATGMQIGVARGQLRSGTYGHRHRRTFACLGDATNLAARLMSAAPPEQIYIAADVAAEASNSFEFEHLAPIPLKGKSEPQAADRLLGLGNRGVARRSHQSPHFLGPVLGRDQELERLVELGRQASAGQGQVVAVVAEAGMGKSTLVAEATNRLAADGMGVYFGATASIGAASYLVWRDIWGALFGVTDDARIDAGRALAQYDPDLLPRLPLLSPLLGLPIEDNSLTRSFDAKLRKSSLEALLQRYLTLRAPSEPMVIWLEDCHWIDSLSADLLDVLARVVSTLPVLFVLTYRPGAFAPPRSPVPTVLELNRLDDEAAGQLLHSRLTELYGVDADPPASLVGRLVERAEGNPFYLGELANYLHSQGVELAPAAATTLDLPVSLSTLVLSRIDALAESPRRTLKVASVVGREFGIDELVGAYPDIGGRRQVAGYLRRLCGQDLVVLEDPEADGYAFKHAVIREVTYDSLPFAMRARLHGQVGSWLEQADPTALDLLAHHFWHSSEDDKKRRYLVQAGEAAQARFANDAAVDYFRRALTVLEEADRPAVLVRLGAVFGLRGDWPDSEATFGEAMDAADRLGDALAATRARTERADTIRKQGRFEEAAAELDEAGRRFTDLRDPPGEGRVLHLAGTIAAQRGDYDLARSLYERSLEVRRRLDDEAAEAALLSNLAIVAEYEEDYEQSEQLNYQALELRTRVGDRWGIGVSRNNLGMVAYLRHDYDQARAHLEEAIRVMLEVGDPWMVAMARHTLGHAARELGDTEAAGRHYADALGTFSLSGDRWSQCPILEDVAMLVADSDPRSALRLIGAAEAIRQEIGSPRPGDQAAKLDSILAAARKDAGNDADSELAGGRTIGAETAVELALALCGPIGMRAERL
jgi:adenylate cyclase